MILQYLKEDDLILVTADEIDTFITNIDDYTSIAFTGTLNCSSTSITKSYTTTEILVNTNFAYIEDDKLYVKPLLFGLTTFADGIYKLVVRIKDTDFTIMQNCIFIDITYKCKVASYLADLIEENKRKDKGDKKATIIHLLHYSLVNGSNCGCNCDEMCLIFAELRELLKNQPIQNNCGC